VYDSDYTRNYLYGTIPVEWASMKNLSSMQAHSNLILVYLIYYVRVSLTQLTNLLCSSLTANRLSGNIPAHLGNFTPLTYLYGLNL
jgi:hypothetical protein